jgi:hydrogenase small subunit
VTYNACATVKWNQGTSFPIESGHGCIGCSEPGFWDFGGFYEALSVPSGNFGNTVVGAAAVGVAAGVAFGALNKHKKNAAKEAHETLTVNDLSKES